MRLAHTLAVVAAFHLAAPASAADLSPARWPASERARLQAADLRTFPATTIEVTGRSGLVTGIGSPTAVHAGREALRQGGTAADAAVTVALTQIAMNLGTVVSYAGVMEVVYFEARTGKVHALDASWSTYARETDPRSIPELDRSFVDGGRLDLGAKDFAEVGRQTLTPGFMAGIEALHGRFGRLPFAELFQPSIWYAENGFNLPPGRAGFLRGFRPVYGRTAAGKQFSSLPDGAAPKPGDLFRQPELAKTLRGVAAHGAAYMYSGSWAHDYVAAVRAEGGKVTLDDLSRYRARWSPPISTTFAGAKVFAVNQPSACAPLNALALLSAAGIDRMGPYWRDPAALKALVRAHRFATRQQYDRAQPLPLERQLGFPNADCRTRLGKRYADVVAPAILRGDEPHAGAPAAAAPPGHHTAAVIAVDRWGNVAALVHSANGFPTGIVVGGVPLINAATVNRWALDGIVPGERVPNPVAPLIALRRGKPVLAIGAVGYSYLPETVRLAAELLSRPATLAETMAAPPLTINPTPPKPGQAFWSWPELLPASAYDADLRRGLTAAGMAFEDVPKARSDGLRGEASVVVIDRAPRAVEIPAIDGFAETVTPP